MPLSNDKIQDRYYKSGIFEDICKKLEQKGIDLNKVSTSDISGIDEFTILSIAVSSELAEEIFLAGSHILDIGCGLGGTARMLAEKHNCKVTGIDLNDEFINTAIQLSDLTRLTDKTDFIQADALNLPFENSSFDVVWIQHVQMSINDKARFYSEINRVLIDEGALVYDDFFKKGKEEVSYPLPYTNNASTSFLESIKLMDAHLTNLGFTKLHSSNQTLKTKHFLSNVLKKHNTNSPPVLGLNFETGKSSMKKMRNLFKGIDENKIELKSGIYRKKNTEHKTGE